MKTKIPWACVLTVFLILLIERGIVALFYPYFSNISTLVLEEKKDFIRQKDFHPDVLFLGDSALAASLDTEEFEKQTGLSAYNMGLYDKVTMAGIYFLLKDYLRHHPKPKAVVLMQGYLFWPTGLEQATMALQTYFHRWDHLASYYRQGVHDPRFLMQVLLHRLFPSLNYRFEFARLLKKGLTGDWKGIQGGRTFHANFVSQIREGRGRVEWREKDPLASVVAQHIRDLKGIKFFVSPINLRYLRLFLQLTQEEGIPVLVHTTPLLKEILESPTAIPFLKGSITFLGSVTKHYPHFRLATTSFLGYAKEHMTGNIFHVNARAAKDFTAAVSKNLQPFLVESNGSLSWKR